MGSGVKRPAVPIRGPRAVVASRAGLGGERATASASSGRIRVLEREPRSLHRCHVVDRDALQILGRERIDEHPELAFVDDEIVVGALVFDEEGVLEPTAATWLHAHSEPAFLRRDSFRRHEPFHLYRRGRRYGKGDVGLCVGGCVGLDNGLLGTSHSSLLEDAEI